MSKIDNKTSKLGCLCSNLMCSTNCFSPTEFPFLFWFHTWRKLGLVALHVFIFETLNLFRPVSAVFGMFPEVPTKCKHRRTAPRYARDNMVSRRGVSSKMITSVIKWSPVLHILAENWLYFTRAFTKISVTSQDNPI